MSHNNVDFLTSLQENNSICLQQTAQTWEEAVYKCFLPLQKSQAVTAAYADHVIANTKEMGPYYIIAPKLAMPHARPEDGVLKNSFSLISLQQPVKFSNNQEVELLIGFAAVDADTHLSIALPQIVAIFEKQTIIEQIIAAKSVTEVLKIIKTIDYMKYVR
ncbi:PTS sugar transporter subunit IIA [Spiroplasma sp. SV19]|uniref:PTS sugar transporter subunit IIA n=1 Tax=Spiroplasma sp. SV19 TaxID=2570468 RepID=UPI0024B80BC3|nr:PTS sugar transporter subunit IIA [Spiroplasma sp. SV19]WHQ37118.1 PTS ascorbate transporter subunit IIA [Spiroplasma sp. SV19]